MAKSSSSSSSRTCRMWSMFGLSDRSRGWLSTGVGNTALGGPRELVGVRCEDFDRRDEACGECAAPGDGRPCEGARREWIDTGVSV